MLNFPNYMYYIVLYCRQTFKKVRACALFVICFSISSWSGREKPVLKNSGFFYFLSNITRKIAYFLVKVLS